MNTRQDMCIFFFFLLLLTMPLFAQDGITGEWQGMLATQHLVLHFDQTATFTAVDQNVTIAIDVVTFHAPALHLEIKRAGATYDGTLSDDGSEIAGTWQQGGHSIPLTFHRPGTVAKSTLKPRTIGSVALIPCRTQDGNTEALCGKYEVFENRQSSRTITLNVMVLPALTDKPAADPWFPLAGGPGQSATELFPLLGVTSKIRQQRDVILVDQRGTGGSNRLACSLRDPNDVQAVIGETVSMEHIRVCRDTLSKTADLTQYTTTNAVDDLDDVRHAMGFDKINLFGNSYGTRAALVYLRRHGEHVRTIALEAVAPPSYRLFVGFPKTIAASIHRLLDRCETDASCHHDFPDLKKEYETIVGRLGKSPAKTEVKSQSVAISLDTFTGDLRPMIYIPELAAQLPYILHTAYQNDWRPFASAAYLARTAIDQTVARGMATSVLCAEDIPGVSASEARHASFQYRLYEGICREWPHVAANKDFYSPVQSNVPALLISGALDPATPPQTAYDAARHLPSSRVVVIKDGSHATASPCIDALITAFLAQDKSLETSCVDQIHLPPFRRAQP